MAENSLEHLYPAEQQALAAQAEQPAMLVWVEMLAEEVLSQHQIALALTATTIFAIPADRNIALSATLISAEMTCI